MNPKRRAIVLIISLIFALPLTAVMYLGDALLGFAFVPFDFFNWITGILPGPLVTFGIDLMIDTFLALGISVANTAKTAEQAIAVLQFVGLVFIAGAIFVQLMRSKVVDANLGSGLIAGSLLGLPLVAITLSESPSALRALLDALWLLALFLGWGAGMALTFKRLRAGIEATEGLDETQFEQVQFNRRSFLITLGAASATLTVVGAGLGAVLSAAERRRLLAATGDSEAHLSEGPLGDPFPNADDPLMPAPGTRPEYTPVKDHYQVFIEVEPTVIREEDWILPITGLVDNPLMLTLQDFREKFPPRQQYVTLSCISGRIGTSLISTTHWTGASVQDVLAEAQVKPEARYLHITSADGFYETVDLELIRSDARIMFCYSWDGNTLPVGHGFPLRIWIPDRYGMKQPKWITGVEVTDEYRPGYWVERSWDEIAQVQTTSVIDTVAINARYESGGEQLIPIGGIAFSGARGISRVEVRVDDGAWQQAQLRAPLSETTWVLWRYDWPFESGNHKFEVRCVEADGTPQVETEQDARPSGATGIHNLEFNL
ncbi:MAG: molybdopterin-dependent oxidoreductase [Anaerolineales bacterium]|jgi:DMSO/TMAO reductase YedYZ molybdopterin-dependent catalytic subunit